MARHKAKPPSTRKHAPADSDNRTAPAEPHRPDPPAGRQLTSATAAWLEHLIYEATALGEGRAPAAPEAEFSPEAGRLYLAALDEVTSRLPELRPEMLVTRAARHALYCAAHEGRDLTGAGERLLAACHAFLAQMPALERGAPPLLPGGGPAAGAEGGGRPAKRTGRPGKGESSKERLVIGALAKHHGYQPGGGIENYAPAKTEGLARLASDKHVKVSVATVSRFLRKTFPHHARGYDGYVAACNRDARVNIGTLLARWQGDVTDRLAGLLPHESGREEDD